MASFVIKKDGTKVPFDREKVKRSISRAALEAGLLDAEAADLAERVVSSIMIDFESQEEVATSDVREKIISELDMSAPSVADSWRKYEETRDM